VVRSLPTRRGWDLVGIPLDVESGWRSWPVDSAVHFTLWSSLYCTLPFSLHSRRLLGASSHGRRIAAGNENAARRRRPRAAHLCVRFYFAALAFDSSVAAGFLVVAPCPAVRTGAIKC